MKEAGVMLIIRDGLILGITRRHDKTKYGLPGGKFDPSLDETVKDTAIRETFEETGIKVKSATFIYQREEKADKPGGEDFYSSCYYALDWEGEPQDSEEGSVKWLSPDEITGPATAAFGDYNKKTLDIFKAIFPEVALGYCSGGCNNTGWQSGDNEGFICDVCDRACTCGVKAPCFVHQK